MSSNGTPPTVRRGPPAEGGGGATGDHQDHAPLHWVHLLELPRRPRPLLDDLQPVPTRPAGSDLQDGWPPQAAGGASGRGEGARALEDGSGEVPAVEPPNRPRNHNRAQQTSARGAEGADVSYVEIEVRARTVELAIEAAMGELGVDRPGTAGGRDHSGAGEGISRFWWSGRRSPGETTLGRRRRNDKAA